MAVYEQKPVPISPLYSVSRIRCHEGGLIDAQRMGRLAEASALDAMRQLADMGYGNMPGATIDEAERLIENELTEAYALVNEVSPDRELTDLFLMKADVHNLKLLLKGRLLGNEEPVGLTYGGIYPAAELAAMIKSGEYGALPSTFSDAILELESEFETQADPVAISMALDSAYIRLGYASKSPFAREYFRAKADFDNILALLRLKAMGAPRERLKKVLLPEGNIGRGWLLAAWDTPPEALAKALAPGGAAEYIGRGLDAIASGAPISRLERERDDFLMALARRGKPDTDTVGPVIGYLLAKEQEARSVRLILTAKRNGLPDAIIMERLRELYA